MSDNQWTDFDDTDTDDSELVKDLRKQIKLRDKRIQEQGKELDGFRKATRSTTVSDRLKAKGINPKAAALVPESVDIDGLDKWIEDYGDILPKTEEPQADPPQQTGDPQSNGSTVPPEEQAAMSAINAAGANAGSGGAAGDVLGQIKAADSKEAVLQLLNSDEWRRATNAAGLGS